MSAIDDLIAQIQEPRLREQLKHEWAEAQKTKKFGPLLIVRKDGAGDAGSYRFDILEPHDPSLADNFEKAVGLARFAEQHGHLFHRIQLIRKQASKAGGERFFRLELNSEAVRKQVLPLTTNPQLDAVFGQSAT